MYLYSVINKSIECPKPVPLAIVVGAIVGSIVTLGLIVLAMLKGIIMFIQWREYKKFIENLGQQQWGQVRTFMDIEHFGTLFCILGRILIPRSFASPTEKLAFC